jgi:hypothetical protein
MPRFHNAQRSSIFFGVRPKVLESFPVSSCCVSTEKLPTRLVRTSPPLRLPISLPLSYTPPSNSALCLETFFHILKPFPHSLHFQLIFDIWYLSNKSQQGRGANSRCAFVCLRGISFSIVSSFRYRSTVRLSPPYIISTRCRRRTFFPRISISFFNDDVPVLTIFPSPLPSHVSY